MFPLGISSARPARISLASTFTLGFLVLLVGAPRCLAWGCNGHKTVAYIAFERLNPRAKSAVLELLSQLPQIPNLKHYCAGDDNPFVQVSTWADDIRTQRPETGPWHYIDIPRGIIKYDKKYCPLPEGCLITAINQQIAVLRDHKASTQSKSMALLFLIHFLGDLHQPLHDISNNDRGGNCVPVSLFGQRPKEFPNENFKPNLHSVWDTDLVERDMAGRSVADFATYLDAKYADLERSCANGHMDFVKWAMESHNHAEAAAYGKLPVSVPVEKPMEVALCSDDSHVSYRLASLNEVVNEPYFLATQEVLEEQLSRAGVRLAVILNRVWH